MASKSKMLAAVFRDRTEASRAYAWLRDRGYRPEEVNIMMTERTRAAYGLHREEGTIKAGTKTPEGMAAGGALGAAFGTGAAAVAVNGTSAVIPGLGWVVAGPIFAALAGGAVGAVEGSAIGTLIGFGIPESNAAAYEEALRHGGVIMGVVPHDHDDADAIKEVFEEHHADNIVYA